MTRKHVARQAERLFPEPHERKERRAWIKEHSPPRRGFATLVTVATTLAATVIYSKLRALRATRRLDRHAER